MRFLQKYDCTTDFLRSLILLGQKGADFKEFLNPHSLEVLRDCQVEPAIAYPEAV